MIAGGLIAASVLLGMFVHQNFFWFTVFVGLNLFQSAFTEWCPMMTILRKLGVPACGAQRPVSSTPAVLPG
jgi:hypothetical protein